MPKISQKGLLMPESPIRKLVPFADVAKKRVFMFTILILDNLISKRLKLH